MFFRASSSGPGREGPLEARVQSVGAAPGGVPSREGGEKMALQS